MKLFNRKSVAETPRNLEVQAHNDAVAERKYVRAMKSIYVSTGRAFALFNRKEQTTRAGVKLVTGRSTMYRKSVRSERNIHRFIKAQFGDISKMPNKMEIIAAFSKVC